MRWLLSATALPLLFLAFACGGGDDDATPTFGPTREPSPVATQSIRKTPTFDIREVDLAAQPEVKAAVEEGGFFAQTDVIYADITNDGFDEAIAPISSGGTLGFLGFVVYTANGDRTELVISEFPSASLGLTVEIQADKLVMVQPAPGPDDPECCPSFLQVTTFAWNGAALAVESVATEPNPDVTSPTPTP